MEDKEKLKDDIVNLFQEKGDAAKVDIEKYLLMVKSPEKKKSIRDIVRFLDLDENGNYYLRKSKTKKRKGG